MNELVCEQVGEGWSIYFNSVRCEKKLYKKISSYLKFVVEE